jgi:hypothetical protein
VRVKIANTVILDRHGEPLKGLKGDLTYDTIYGAEFLGFQVVGGQTHNGTTYQYDIDLILQLNGE